MLVDQWIKAVISMLKNTIAKPMFKWVSHCFISFIEELLPFFKTPLHLFSLCVNAWLTFAKSLTPTMWNLWAQQLNFFSLQRCNQSALSQIFLKISISWCLPSSHYKTEIHVQNSLVQNLWQHYTESVFGHKRYAYCKTRKKMLKLHSSPSAVTVRKSCPIIKKSYWPWLKYRSVASNDIEIGY